MEGIPAVKPSEVAPLLHVLDTVRDSGLLERYDVDVSARLEDIKEQVRSAAARYYDQKMSELHAQPGVNHALPFLLLTDEIEKSAKLLDKRFPEPLLGYVLRTKMVICAHEFVGISTSCPWSSRSRSPTSWLTSTSRGNGCSKTR